MTNYKSKALCFGISGADQAGISAHKRIEIKPITSAKTFSCRYLQIMGINFIELPNIIKIITGITDKTEICQHGGYDGSI